MPPWPGPACAREETAGPATAARAGCRSARTGADTASAGACCGSGSTPPPPTPGARPRRLTTAVLWRPQPRKCPPVGAVRGGVAVRIAAVGAGSKAAGRQALGAGAGVDKHAQGRRGSAACGGTRRPASIGARAVVLRRVDPRRGDATGPVPGASIAMGALPCSASLLAAPSPSHLHPRKRSASGSDHHTSSPRPRPCRPTGPLPAILAHAAPEPSSAGIRLPAGRSDSRRTSATNAAPAVAVPFACSLQHAPPGTAVRERSRRFTVGSNVGASRGARPQPGSARSFGASPWLLVQDPPQSPRVEQAVRYVSEACEPTVVSAERSMRSSVPAGNHTLESRQTAVASPGSIQPHADFCRVARGGLSLLFQAVRPRKCGPVTRYAYNNPLTDRPQPPTLRQEHNAFGLRRKSCPISPRQVGCRLFVGHCYVDQSGWTSNPPQTRVV